jgi:hypothetical protein
MSEQPITLPTGGGLPGIPGDHAPGNYLVDYVERTIRPAPLVEDTSGPTQPLPDLTQSTPSEQPASPVVITDEIAHLEDEIKTLTAEQQQHS